MYLKLLSNPTFPNPNLIPQCNLQLTPVQPTLTPVQPTLTPVQLTLTPVQSTANPSATSLNEIDVNKSVTRLSLA